MYEIIRLELHKQNSGYIPGIVELFETLVPKAFHSCLHNQDPKGISNTSIITFAACYQGYAVGIALASNYLHTHQVRLHFIGVKKEHSNHHLARQLLEKLQIAAKHEGGGYFVCNYSLEDPETPALQKVLAACGWKLDQPFSVECLYNSYTFNPPWIHIPYKLPSSMKEFAWSELTEQDRQQIIHDEHRGVIPLAVLPFRQEHLIEPLNSLGLRYEGRVVGWIITHRIAEDKIVYKSLYIEREFHFMGPGVKLLIDSMLIQKTLPIKWAVFELPLHQVQPAWVQFINKRLIPYADQVTHHVQAWS